MAASSSSSPSMAASSSSSSSMVRGRFVVGISSQFPEFPLSSSSSQRHLSKPLPSPSMAAIYSSLSSSSSPSPSMEALHSSLSSNSPSMAAFHSSTSPLMAAFHPSSSPPSMAASLSSSLSPPMAASSSSATTAPQEKKLYIECANSEITEVSLTVALQSEKLMNCYTENSAIVKGPIQLPEVTKPVFDKAMKFCEMELKARKSSGTFEEKEELKRFGLTFSEELQDLDTLYDLIQAAHTLRINSLLDRTCQCAADMMNGKTVKQVRELFNIENDYTPEEEDAVRREFTWRFET